MEKENYIINTCDRDKIYLVCSREPNQTDRYKTLGEFFKEEHAEMFIKCLQNPSILKNL